MTHPVEPHEIAAAGNETWPDEPFRWIGIVVVGSILGIAVTIGIIAGVIF